ncbi:MAG: ABC transporter ATP-binding protein [Alphaproteobacteria bacterium]|nr:ABC transporter ATP-binding protein [Alphaproteobacteria bacterium]
MTVGTKAASVKFEGVTKAFGTVRAVDTVSFVVEPGTLATLLGPSGCGKTTTLRMIAGLELPTSGRILIGERDVSRIHATERDVSMVFQSYALFPHMTVLENVCYGLEVRGANAKEVKDRAREGLKLVSLEGYDSRMPSELSGGQQQRVAVARALVLEPQVLLFDEPLSNLDAKLRRRMREDIRELQQKLGLTAVYVTHDQAEALAVSDKVIVMHQGRIAQQGGPLDLYEAPDNLFVADFIGDANVVKGELSRSGARDHDAGPAIAMVRLGNLELLLPHRDVPDGPVDVAIRPQAVILATTRPGRTHLEGTISKAAYIGSHMEYEVSTPLGEMFVIDQATGRQQPRGRTVYITFGDRGVTVVKP